MRLESNPPQSLLLAAEEATAADGEEPEGATVIRNPSLSVALVRYVSALHLGWGVMLLFSATAGHATTTAALLKYLQLGRPGVALLLILASGVALWVLFRADGPSILTAVLLTPQGMLLTLAAIGATSAIYSSQFADGVERSRWFIAADQSWAIWLWVFHFTVVLGLHLRRIRWRP